MFVGAACWPGMTDTTRGGWRWFATDGHEIPTRVWCPELGYPAEDEHGRRQYRNTHFVTEADAWEHGQACVDAGVRLDVHDAKRLRKELARAQERLSRDTERQRDFNDARRARGPIDDNGASDELPDAESGEALSRARELARRWADCADGLLVDEDGLASLFAWVRARLSGARWGDVAVELGLTHLELTALCDAAGCPSHGVRGGLAEAGRSRE